MLLVLVCLMVSVSSFDFPVKSKLNNTSVHGVLRLTVIFSFLLGEWSLRGIEPNEEMHPPTSFPSFSPARRQKFVPPPTMTHAVTSAGPFLRSEMDMDVPAFFR
jgi:hypothetical protein